MPPDDEPKVIEKANAIAEALDASVELVRIGDPADTASPPKTFVGIDLGTVSDEKANAIAASFREHLFNHDEEPALADEPITNGRNGNKLLLLDAEYVRLNGDAFISLLAEKRDVIPQEAHDAHLNKQEAMAFNEKARPTNPEKAGIRGELAEMLDADVDYSSKTRKFNITFKDPNDAEKFKVALENAAGTDKQKLGATAEVGEAGSYAEGAFVVSFNAAPLVPAKEGDKTPLYAELEKNAVALKGAISANEHDAYKTKAEQGTEAPAEDATKVAARLKPHADMFAKVAGQSVQQYIDIASVEFDSAKDADGFDAALIALRNKAGIPMEELPIKRVSGAGVKESVTIDLKDIEKYDAKYGAGEFFKKMEAAKAALKAEETKKPEDHSVENDKVYAEVAARLSKKLGKEIKVGRMKDADGIPEFTFEGANEAEAMAVSMRLAKARAEAGIDDNKMSIRPEGASISIDPKALLVLNKGKVTPRNTVISKLESSLETSAEQAKNPPPVEDKDKKDDKEKKENKDEKSATGERTDNVPPPPEDNRNIFSKNQGAILGGLGGLFMFLFAGLDPIMAILGALVVSVLGSSFIDKEGGFMSQIFPGSKRSPEAGAGNEPTREAGYSQARAQENGGQGYQPLNRNVAMLADRKIDDNEMRQLIAQGGEKYNHLHDAASMLKRGVQDGRVVMTPNRQEGNIGPIIYARYNDRSQLVDIQVAREDGVIVKVKDGDYTERDAAAIIEASKSAPAMDKGATKLDEMQELMKGQFTPQSTPGQDKVAGRGNEKH